MMRTMLLSTFATLLLVSTAVADERGAQLLSDMDAAMTMADDQYFEYELVNAEPGRDPKVMEIHVTIKGEQRLTEFAAPGDMKGTRALVQSRDVMYIYLPAYNKVRRVASHLTSGGFLGTTFSNDDISTTIYGPSYDGKFVEETETAWVVEGTLKEGQKGAYTKLVFTIDKTHKQPTEIQYFGKKGAHIKTEVRSEYSCQEDICNAGSMKMTDHTKGDASTELVRRAWKVNEGADDSLFSVRNLSSQ